jgi:hypothetical protein
MNQVVELHKVLPIELVDNIKSFIWEDYEFRLKALERREFTPNGNPIHHCVFDNNEIVIYETLMMLLEVSRDENHYYHNKHIKTFWKNIMKKLFFPDVVDVWYESHKNFKFSPNTTPYFNTLRPVKYNYGTKLVTVSHPLVSKMFDCSFMTYKDSVTCKTRKGGFGNEFIKDIITKFSHFASVTTEKNYTNSFRKIAFEIKRDIHIIEKILIPVCKRYIEEDNVRLQTERYAEEQKRQRQIEIVEKLKKNNAKKKAQKLAEIEAKKQARIDAVNARKAQKVAQKEAEKQAKIDAVKARKAQKVAQKEAEKQARIDAVNARKAQKLADKEAEKQTRIDAVNARKAQKVAQKEAEKQAKIDAVNARKAQKLADKEAKRQTKRK